MKLLGVLGRRKSLSGKIITPLVGATVVVVSLLIAFQAKLEWERGFKSLRSEMSTLGAFLQTASTPYVMSWDTVSLEDFVSKGLANPNVNYLLFLNQDDQPMTFNSQKTDVDEELMLKIKDPAGKLIGKLQIGFTHRLARTAAQKSLIPVVLANVILILVNVLFIIFVTKRIVGPFDRVRLDLGQTAVGNKSAAGELTGSAEALKSRSNEQAEAVRKLSESMTEIKSMIQVTLSTIEEAKSRGMRITEKTSEGSRSMAKMVGSVEDLQTSNDRLAKVNTVIEEIRKKTDVINQIVLKTQLLSFNASIEAAHAGHKGTGFAVVAEEIGNLAQMSGEAAAQIGNLIRDSQRQVESVISDVLDKITEGKKTTEEARYHFEQISTDIEQVSNAINEVATSSHEQFTCIEQTWMSFDVMNSSTQNQLAAVASVREIANKVYGYSDAVTVATQKLHNLLEGGELKATELKKDHSASSRPLENTSWPKAS